MITTAEQERLVLLLEEASEVQQNVCKALRHGYNSIHPKEIQTNNADLIEMEIGDLLAIIDIMVANGDLNQERLNFYKKDKIRRIKKYLHFEHKGIE